jgi:hypothetical protein
MFGKQAWQLILVNMAGIFRDNGSVYSDSCSEKYAYKQSQYR